MTRHVTLAAVFLLVLSSAPASAERLRFTYEGTIVGSYPGLLDALGIDPLERVVFSFVVETDSSDPTRTGTAFSHRDVLSSTLTVGSFKVRGGKGLTQVFNGPFETVDFDDFYAYSTLHGRVVRLNGRRLKPSQAFLSLQGDSGAVTSSAYPSAALDPLLFGVRRLSISYTWADDPSSGVGITVEIDHATTTPASVP